MICDVLSIHTVCITIIDSITPIYNSTCRINFTIEDLAPVAPAYNHFMSCLETMYSTGNNGVVVLFTAEQLSTEFEQYFEYERVKELVSTL